MATPSSPKPDINSKIWQNIVRRHLLSTAQATAGNYDGDVAKARQNLADIKSGKVKLHHNATGQGFVELQAGNSGKYSLSAADEEAILKEVGDKLSEERMAKAEHSVKQEKWNKESKVILDKLNKESIEIEAKLKKKFGTDLAGYNSAQGNADREMEIKIKKAQLELDQKMPKAKSPLNEQINVARGEGQALSQHRRIMALPEKERAEAFKKLIDTFSEKINDSPESKQQTEHTVKRLQELAAEDGVTKPKLSRAIAAVGGAVKKAGAALLPASGRTTSLPSEVVRPTTATATPPSLDPLPPPPPIPPKPATPVPAGLPPPPSAATIPPASTASGTVSTPPVWTGPNTRAGVPAPAVAVDDAQAQLARLNGAGGVSGVSRDGIQVAETTEEFIERTKGTGKEGIHKVNKKALPNASYEPTVRVETQPIDPAVTARNATRRAQLERQAKTGQLPPKSKLDIANGESLLDVAKRKMPTYAGWVDSVANIGGPSKEKRDAAERFKAEQKVKADAKAALADLDKNPVAVKPEKVFYNPQSGRQGVISPEATPSRGRALMSSFGDRLTKTLYSDILPYARGEPMKAEIAKLFGEGATQRSFLERALQRSGRFTPEEIQVAWRSIMNNPDAMATLTPAIGHLPAEGQPLPNQPLQSGGAPKPLPQRPTGNSLPKVTPIEETARDRLAAQRQLQAEAKALAEAQAKAAQDAELLRIAAEEKAAFDQLKHDRLVEAANAAERKALIDEIKARSPAGTEDAWEGTPFSSNSAKTNFFPATSGITRQDRLRQISIENKKGVTLDEVMLQKWLKSRGITSTPESQAATGRPTLPFIRGMERGIKPPSAGMQAAGQVGNFGAQSVGFLPDIMTAYALSRGGPISGSGQVLYPSEVSSMEGNGSFENAALSSLARWHPDNAAENPDITHQQRNAYWEKFYGNSNVPQWYRDETDARNQDIAEFVKRTGFTPEPRRGSQPVPQAILDAIQSQR